MGIQCSCCNDEHSIFYKCDAPHTPPALDYKPPTPQLPIHERTPQERLFDQILKEHETRYSKLLAEYRALLVKTRDLESRLQEQAALGRAPTD